MKLAPLLITIEPPPILEGALSLQGHSRGFEHDGRPHTAYCFAWDAEWWCVTFTDCREGHAGDSVRLRRVRYGTAGEALDRAVLELARTQVPLG